MFEVTEKQREQIKKFCKEQDEIVRQEQLKSADEIVRQEQLKSADEWIVEEARLGRPYYGAIGGSLTYCFTGTSLGTILVVKHASGAELNVTDFENW